MVDRRDVTARLSQLVMTVDEYERLMTGALPHLLNHATTQTRRFLRETGQWGDDVCHEKLALRWGYELVERFLMYGRTEIPVGRCSSWTVSSRNISVNRSRSVMTRNSCRRSVAFWKG